MLKCSKIPVQNWKMHIYGYFSQHTPYGVVQKIKHFACERDFKLLRNHMYKTYFEPFILLQKAMQVIQYSSHTIPLKKIALIRIRQKSLENVSFRISCSQYSDPLRNFWETLNSSKSILYIWIIWYDFGAHKISLTSKVSSFMNILVWSKMNRIKWNPYILTRSYLN